MQGCRSDLHKHNRLCLYHHISTEFALQTLVRPSRGPESSAVPPGTRCCFCAVSVFEEYFKAGRVRHSTNYILVLVASIISSTSPRFSEVLFSRSRHSKWPMSLMGHWIFFVSEKPPTAIHCAPQLTFPFTALKAFAAITIAQ